MSSPRSLTFFFTTLLTVITTLFPSPVSSQSCHRTCGTIPIKYPFGTGPGCGDPKFNQYVTCDNDDQVLTLTTHTGSYPITGIDYVNQVIYIVDPTMSTCACSRPSRGFGLDWDSPFSFHDDTVFTLLDCDVNSSPIFKPSSNSTSRVPLCDKQSGVSVCSFLYSNCRAISVMNLPIATCCVYTPVDLGPAFEMDLQKLHCSAYSAFYSFSGQQSDPANWKYGMALKYKYNVYDEYPGTCEMCERSNGACGYNTNGASYRSFTCSCTGGMNTTTDCFFINSYNSASGLLYAETGTWLLISSLAWMLTGEFL